MKTVFLVVKKHTNKEGKKRKGEGVGVWERNGRKDDRQGLRISHISKFFPFWAATHFPYCFLRAKNCCNVLRVFGSKYLDIKAEREVWLYWRRCLPSLAGITNHCLLVVIGVNAIYKLKSRMCSNLVHGGRGRKHYTSTMLHSKPNLDPKLKCKEKKDSGKNSLQRFQNISSGWNKLWKQIYPKTKEKYWQIWLGEYWKLSGGARFY